MSVLKRLIRGSVFVFILAGTAVAQEMRAPAETPREPVIAAAPLVTVTASAQRVRFVSPGTVVQLRLEVYNEAGQKLFDTELRGGNVLDWHMQDGAGQRLQSGSYACVLTIKSLSGRLSQRVGRVTVNEKAVAAVAGLQLSTAQQQTIGPVEGNAAFTVRQESEALTVVTHDGTDGQLTSTAGALTFRTGDVFAGADKEHMRITREGNVGIGTDKPAAKLDVAGTIRAERVLIVKPWQVGAANKTSGADSPQADAQVTVEPAASGSGTQDRIAKWIDNVGTLGDSGITEIVGGNVGIGTTTPGALLDVTNNTNHLQYSPTTAKLTLTGPASNLTANPGLRLDFNSDPDAAFSYLAYSHDNISQAFDAYWNGAAWVSSHLGANFALYKTASQFAIGFNAGTAKGSTFPSFNTSTGAIFSNTGSLGIGGAPASAKLYVNGNVGIGTTTPTQRLDVVGNIKASGSLTGATANVVNQLIVDTNTLVVNAANNRVGIGTLTPAVPLDVVGDINTSTRYNIAGSRVLSNAGLRNLFAGVSAGAVNTGFDNSFFGSSAGAANTAGAQNSFFGSSAGAANTTAQGNSFFGASSGAANTGGQNNSFFGAEAGQANTSGLSNSFFGSGAGDSNTTGGSNSFFGGGTGGANTTGTYNSFFGDAAGIFNNTGGSNSFFGFNSGAFNTTGSNNSFFGLNAGFANTTASNNAFFGTNAGQANTTGTSNAFFGTSAGAANSTASNNAFFGYLAGTANTTGIFNSFFGTNAGKSNTTTFNSSFFGYNAGAANTAGDNSFFGSSAGAATTSGSVNSFFGSSAGAANITGAGNSFFGNEAGEASTAHSNSFFGRSAGKANTIGTANSFFGSYAGDANTTANYNSYFGFSTGGASGSYNSFFGFSAGGVNTASSNTFMGHEAGEFNSSGANNSFFGESAGSLNTSGASNSFFGRNAGLSNTVETNNTFVGSSSNGTSGITNATAVGANAVVTQSDSLVLGNGVKVGAGTSSPKEKLHILGGNIYIDGVAASDNGVILKSPDGLTCAKLTISNAGALVTTVITCP